MWRLMWQPSWYFNLGPDSLHCTGFTPQGRWLCSIWSRTKWRDCDSRGGDSNLNNILKCKKCRGHAAPPDSRSCQGSRMKASTQQVNTCSLTTGNPQPQAWGPKDKGLSSREWRGERAPLRPPAGHQLNAPPGVHKEFFLLVADTFLMIFFSFLTE